MLATSNMEYDQNSQSNHLQYRPSTDPMIVYDYGERNNNSAAKTIGRKIRLAVWAAALFALFANSWAFGIVNRVYGTLFNSEKGLIDDSCAPNLKGILINARFVFVIFLYIS